MSAISTASPQTDCKGAISDYRLIASVINLAKKIQTFVADVFYTICYFTFPSMSVRPYEIWGLYRHHRTEAYQEFVGKGLAEGEHFCRNYAIECGNQKFQCRKDKLFDAREVEYWFNNTVSYANRARLTKISFQFWHMKEATMLRNKTETYLGQYIYQGRGKNTPPRIEKVQIPGRK